MHTTLCISKDNYFHTQRPILNSVKGSGSAGNEWSFISIPMVKIVEETSKGWHSHNFSEDNYWCTHMSGFIDDARNFVNLPTREENVIDLCTKLHDAAQSWEHLLIISGGKLNTEKCAIYIL